MGFFDRIKQSLTRTKEQFVERFEEVVKRADEPARRSQPIDVETVDALEEALISADVGVAATEQIVEAVRARRGRGESLRALVKEEIRDILRGDMKFRGVVFSDDIGMAAAFSAGGIRSRIDAHLDAGCDVVLVCHPELVPESLAAVEGRALNTAAITGLIGRGPMAWDGLLADERYADTRSRIEGLA